MQQGDAAMNTTSSKSAKGSETPDAETLAAEIAALRSQLASLVETLGGEAATAAAKARAAGETIASELVEDWHEIDRKVAEATRKTPWRALGIAALAGLALGAILRR